MPTQDQINMWDINGDGLLNQADIDFARDIGMHSIADAIQNVLSGGTGNLDIVTAGDEMTEDEYQEYLADPQAFIDSSLSYAASLAAEDAAISGQRNIQGSQFDAGLSTGAVGSREELGRMLAQYKGRTSLIQASSRQKQIYTIDRFDGGLNLNKSPRDLAYWEACSMDELTPSKVGRLIRLGDFTKDWDSSGAAGYTYAMALAGAERENYGLHYFKWSDSINDGNVVDGTLVYELDGGSPCGYLAYDSGDGGVDLWNFDDSGGGHKVSSAIAASTFAVKDATFGAADDEEEYLSYNETYKPVFHSAGNRLFVSDATFETSRNRPSSVNTAGTYMACIVDRPSYFPYTHTDGSLKHNVPAGATEDDADAFSTFETSQPLYQAAPVAGITGDGNVAVTNSATGLLKGSTDHKGIYINVRVDNISGDEDSGTGWGDILENSAKHYKMYASFLYDNGSETKLTDVTSTNNASAGATSTIISITTGSSSDLPQYKKLVIAQVMINAPAFYAANFRRIHGARIYWNEVNSSGGTKGKDKFLLLEIDFRYGLSVGNETLYGSWNMFENEDADGTTATAAELASLQVLNASNTGTGTDNTAATFGSIELISRPIAFTYYTLNLFAQEEIRTDLMWKTSSVGKGVAYIGNIKYDGREYPDVMLYSGAGETNAGSNYPMWGTFPVDSNRITIPGAAGEITAILTVDEFLLQFRRNALYVINVSNPESPNITHTYQGMGVYGQWAVTRTSFGAAWANDTGVYSYNGQAKKALSLTIGRLDTEDINIDENTKIGYDDRAKSLIVANYSQRANASTYAYAYSFVTDAWCTWSQNRGSYTPISNFTIDHSGYLVGASRSGTDLILYKWSAESQSTVTIDYITKDIDLSKPNLDKRFYTIYISYTGGTSNSISVYFRVNGIENRNLTDNWLQLSSIDDYTDPYRNATNSSWLVPVISDLTVIAGTATVTTDEGHSMAVGDIVYIDANNNDYDETYATITEVPSAFQFKYEVAKSNVSGLTGTFHSLTGDAKVPSSSTRLDSINTSEQKLAKINLRQLSGSVSRDYFKFARSIQLRFNGTSASTFEVNDISIVFKEKRLK